MNSFNFKNVLKSFKESKKNIDETKKIISYKEVIEDKLKNNKNEKSILRHFDQIEDERKEWFNERNKSLNNVKDEVEKPNEEDSSQDKDLNLGELTGDILFEENIPEDLKTEISEKVWEVTVNPKKYICINFSIIEETTVENDIKRFINTDKFTKEFKCKELYNWFHKMFQEWEKELDV